tara:strand:- start:376 stop:1068 length:693 start_codon:yes stop_codon:yes gene_type:complete
MTVNITETERFLRRKLTKLESALRQMPAKIERAPTFKNLILNGGFDAGTVGFSATSTAATISAESGALRVNSTTFAGVVSDQFKVVNRAKYKVSVDILENTGNNAILVQQEANGSNGVTSVNSVSVGSHNLYFYGGQRSAAFSVANVNSATSSRLIDNIQAWEVDPSDNAPWLRLPFGQRVGKQGHIVRDNVTLMASDYKEIEVYGQYFIKPLVAPGVNTEFDVYCGIGA